MTGSFVASFPADMDGGQHVIQVEIDQFSETREVRYPSLGPPLVLWGAIALGALVVAALALWLVWQRQSHGRLVFVGGPRDGEWVPVRGPKIRIGALHDNDVVLESEGVSRQHAVIRVRGRVVTLEDLRSTNGTYVNGEAVGARPLRRGDKLRIGEGDLLYQ
jgi:pSer/pThr/pTyr-binding forkhead associated (FHA) protein